ncbi:MAG: hypothetical protein IPG05_09185 [Gemmatimonadetes bacterium]|nr:hypothetical protein [Gemmatimonadota bacterium]
MGAGRLVSLGQLDQRGGKGDRAPLGTPAARSGTLTSGKGWLSPTALPVYFPAP